MTPNGACRLCQIVVIRSSLRKFGTLKNALRLSSDRGTIGGRLTGCLFLASSGLSDAYLSAFGARSGHPATVGDVRSHALVEVYSCSHVSPRSD
jgi:hypothetical protein